LKKCWESKSKTYGENNSECVGVLLRLAENGLKINAFDESLEWVEKLIAIQKTTDWSSSGFLVLYLWELSLQKRKYNLVILAKNTLSIQHVHSLNQL